MAEPKYKVQLTAFCKQYGVQYSSINIAGVRQWFIDDNAKLYLGTVASSKSKYAIVGSVDQVLFFDNRRKRDSGSFPFIVYINNVCHVLEWCSIHSEKMSTAIMPQVADKNSELFETFVSKSHFMLIIFISVCCFNMSSYLFVELLCHCSHLECNFVHMCINLLQINYHDMHWHQLLLYIVMNSFHFL